MVRDLLNVPNHVHGEFKLERGRLVFQTGDVAMLQRLRADREHRRHSTVLLLSAEPSREFIGSLETVELVKTARPQEWRAVMFEAGGKPRKRG